MAGMRRHHYAMILAALLAALFIAGAGATVQRMRYMTIKADYHEQKSLEFAAKMMGFDPTADTDAAARKEYADAMQRHSELERKYRRAVLWPWRVVRE